MENTVPLWALNALLNISNQHVRTMYYKLKSPGQETTKDPLSCVRELKRGFHRAGEYAGRLCQFRALSVPEDVYVQEGQILSNPWFRSYYNCYFLKMRRIICMCWRRQSDNCHRLLSGWDIEKVFVLLPAGEGHLIYSHK